MNTETNFDTPPENPFQLFALWLKAAEQHGIYEARGMTLCTVNAESHPSSRTVLLKEYDDHGITFVSSENSRKGKDLLVNPWASGTVWWRESNQQVHFQGKIKKHDDKKSDELFYERPRASQAAAAVSIQSARLEEDEASLKARVTKLIESNKKIERPATWHGYYFMIESMEFWIGDLYRFHRRLRYDLISGAWQHYRLQP